MAYQAKERLGACLVEDVCVPRSALPDMINDIEATAARHDVLIATVAHAGDGNLHPVFIFDTDGRAAAEVWAAADEVFTGRWSWAARSPASTASACSSSAGSPSRPAPSPRRSSTGSSRLRPARHPQPRQSHLISATTVTEQGRVHTDRLHRTLTRRVR